MSLFEFTPYRYMEEAVPEWARLERYEYCEPYEKTSMLARSGSRRPAVIQFLLSLF